MERIRHRGLEIVLGIVLAATMVVTVTLILESFAGKFSNKIKVSAHISKAGDALAQGDIVTYQRVIIGDVEATQGAPDGAAVVRLVIDPKDAKQIPASVKAIAVPASLFGNTKIVLMPSARGGRPLRDGDVIAADTSPAAESLQTALSNVYTLVTSVHPAQLQAALSALATALEGQGANLGRLIVKTDGLLRRIAPHLPEVDDTLRSLATLTGEIARDAPSMLASLRDAVVVAQGLIRDRASLDALLAVAPTALDNAQRLLSVPFVDQTVTVLRNLVPITGALAQHPTALIDTITGFRTFANTFNSTLSSGPYLSANVLLTGADFTELAPLVLGGKGKVFDSIVDPPLYSAKDCPRYPGASGPNCGSASASSSNAKLLSTGTNYSGTASSVGSGREQRAVSAAAGAATSTPVGRLDPATTDILFGPMLRGSLTVIP